MAALQDRAFRIESLARSSFLEAQRLFSTVATFLLGKRPTPEGVDWCEEWQSGLASTLSGCDRRELVSPPIATKSVKYDRENHE